MDGLAHITPGIEALEGGLSIPRHRHGGAYVAVVLSGGYEECGGRGRFRVGPGDVLLHSAFDAHLDRVARTGATILNLGTEFFPAFSHGRIDDPDRVARLAERNVAQALADLEEQLHPSPVRVHDWPDLLATDLISDPDRRLDDWARAHGLAPATVSRGFDKVFGVSPKAFRLEARARTAYEWITNGSGSLADIAARAGFTDQPHMSRAVRALTGRSPGWWRGRSRVKSVQDLR